MKTATLIELQAHLKALNLSHMVSAIWKSP